MAAPATLDASLPRKPWEENPERSQSVLNMVQPSAAVTPYHPPNVWSPTPNSWSPYGHPYTWGQGYPGGGEGDRFDGLSGPIFPSNSSFGMAETTLRRGLSSIGILLRTMGGIVRMIDATVYASWSSIMAVVTTIEQLKYLKREHIDRVWSLIIGLFERLLGRIRITKSQRSHSITAVVKQESRGSSTTPTRSFLKVALLAAMGYFAYKRVASLGPKSPIMARAICSFTSADPSCIDVVVGDELLVLQMPESSEWALVRNVRTNQEGFVPSSYVKCVASKS